MVSGDDGGGPASALQYGLYLDMYLRSSYPCRPRCSVEGREFWLASVN
jgi:hypothetical protein